MHGLYRARLSVRQRLPSSLPRLVRTHLPFQDGPVDRPPVVPLPAVCRPVSAASTAGAKLPHKAPDSTLPPLLPQLPLQLARLPAERSVLVTSPWMLARLPPKLAHLVAQWLRRLPELTQLPPDRIAFGCGPAVGRCGNSDEEGDTRQERDCHCASDSRSSNRHQLSPVVVEESLDDDPPPPFLPARCRQLTNGYRRSADFPSDISSQYTPPDTRRPTNQA